MVNSKSDLPVQVRILDVNGKALSSSRIQLSKGGTFRVGENLTGGTWFAEITQGDKREVIRLFKLN